jgi:hypothetical protein
MCSGLGWTTVAMSSALLTTPAIAESDVSPVLATPSRLPNATRTVSVIRLRSRFCVMTLFEYLVEA